MKWIIWIHNTDLFFTVHTKDLGSQTGNRKSMSFWDIVTGFPQHWFSSTATLWQVGHTRLDNCQWRNAPLCRQTWILVLLRRSSSLPDVRGIPRTVFHLKSHRKAFSSSSRSLDLHFHHHSNLRSWHQLDCGSLCVVLSLTKFDSNEKKVWSRHNSVLEGVG